MKTFASFTILAFVALAASRLSGAGEPGCNAEPSCGAPACCDPGTCCPKCGCHEGLIPVCHPYCTTKKVVKYHYCCKCEELCIPGRFPCCPKCGDGCCEHGGCAEQGCGNDCGCEQGKCNCLTRGVHTLVKIPYFVEVPVRKCSIEWVCPKCGGCCGCNEKSDAGPAPAGPTPAPSGPTPPPPPFPGKSASAPSTRPTAAGYNFSTDRTVASAGSK
jgi:hypothetical protein